MTPNNTPEPSFTTGRRHLLKALGTGTIGAIIGTGTATAQSGFPPEKHTEWGESGDLNENGIDNTQAFVTTTPSGKPQFVGVQICADELSGLPEGDDDIHTHEVELFLDLPSGTPFTVVEVDWNADGHPPEGIYDVPHLDFHFYTLDESTVETIQTEPATYAMPDDQMPTDYIRPPLVDTNDDGEPDAPLVEAHMGEHLVDPTAPEFQEDGEFTHAFIWGAWDPDDDGCGELTFFEPMITREFLLEQHKEVTTEIKMPDALPTAGWYPTEYVIRYLGNNDTYVVTLESFEHFPASIGCNGGG